MKSQRASLTSTSAAALAAALTTAFVGAPASALPQHGGGASGWPSATRSSGEAAPELAWWAGPVVVAASPVPGSIALGSHFGFRHGRLTGRRTFHAGLDFPAPEGTSVFAARPGTVERVVHDEDRTPGFRGYGNAVVIHHPSDDHWTLYAHLSGVRVVPGQRVLAGQRLGAVGSSSNGRFHGMGTHLHFEVRHRRASGEAPFPGPYRWNNLDPARWLADRGVRYGEGGVVAADGELVVGGADRPVMVLASRTADAGSGYRAWRAGAAPVSGAAKPVDAKPASGGDAATNGALGDAP